MIPLLTMLSHTLVAWTIEVDNAYELRMPHRTTASRQRGEVLNGPWLVSFAMYVQCIRHLTAEGLTLGGLEGRARVLGPVSGLERWGYVVVQEPGANGERGPDPRSAIVRPTDAALRAQGVWAALPDEVDARWKRRHDATQLRKLREALVSVVAALDADLPDFLPVIRGNGALLNLLPGDERLPARYRTQPPAPSEPAAEPMSLPFYALLSKVLLAFALEYEREARRALALGANLLRVLGVNAGVHVTELPRLVGVSKEAIVQSLTRLKREVAVEKAPNERTRHARLTPRGLAAQQTYLDLIGDIERRWATRFGRDVLGTMRSSLEAIVVTTDLGGSPLLEAYGPLPGTWRAEMPIPDTLPHYPMVLHRGGYPDGA